MSFCTSIHCIDGRIQESLIDYLKNKYNVKYIDTITEPGPCKILSENTDKRTVDSILSRVSISRDAHKSKIIAISGHYDCAANPLDEEEQKEQVRNCVNYLNSIISECEIIGLWINKNWQVSEVRL